MKGGLPIHAGQSKFEELEDVDAVVHNEHNLLKVELNCYSPKAKDFTHLNLPSSLLPVYGNSSPFEIGEEVERQKTRKEGEKAEGKEEGEGG